MQIIFQALDAIRANVFRVGLTMFIIAIGLTALVGVVTSIEGVKYWMVNSFSSLGANTFRILDNSVTVKIGGRRSGGKKTKKPNIELKEALAFKKEFGDKATICVTGAGNFAATVKFGQEKTNPNIQVIGTDDNYLNVYRYNVAEGRNFSDDELEEGAKCILIGWDVKQTLFPYSSALGKKVNVDNNIYKVVGVLAELGQSGSMGGDKIVLIPIPTLRTDFPSSDRSYSINVFVDRPEQMDYTMEEAKGIFRFIRQVAPGEPNNFDIAKSDQFAEEILKDLRLLTFSATLIAFITLFGASIALLNVMLVSVTDRTQEIGVRKALGATKVNILLQFLAEAILICQIGGILGIFMGLGAGNLVSQFIMKTGFVVPWAWIGGGIVLCFFVGIISGIYPAWKAARVDPIDSLRHE